jgi:threonine dehydrogenase-like Zn-dependent dehydrogenase
VKRVVKRAGVGNIEVEEAPVPTVGNRQILVRNVRTLISPGSEIGRRYLHPDEVDPAIMGYSSAGVIEAVAEDVTDFEVGQRVALSAPHAEYVVGNVDRDHGSRITAIPDHVSFDLAPYQNLVTGALMWSEIAGVQEGDTVVVLGQGLVGLLMQQALRAYAPGRLIAVDAMDSRCRLAEKLGADVVINATREDPVASVLRLTNGTGAEVVIDCVGGKAGLTSFAQAQDMCRRLGRIHLIGLYHGEPLPLDSSKIQQKLLIGGYFTTEPRGPAARRAMARIADGTIDVASLTTHTFPFARAKDAFDLLYHRPNEALGVLLAWD